MSEPYVTTDHEKIREWTEERGGHPATVAATVKNGGLMTIVTLDAADGAGSSGTITIDGAGSEVDVAGASSIGGDGLGILSIKNQGAIGRGPGHFFEPRSCSA